MRSLLNRNNLKAAFFFAALVIFAASCFQQQKKTEVTLTAAETPEPPVVNASDSTFSKFNHTIEEHKKFDCVSCHRRDAKQTLRVRRTRFLRWLSFEPVHESWRETRDVCDLSRQDGRESADDEAHFPRNSSRASI